MAQTAITKALQSVEDRMKSTNNEARWGELNAVHIILTSLLPYERETIEAAYEDGSTNLEFGTPSYVHKTDYFTKTYNQ
jgi:hypothetical protein